MFTRRSFLAASATAAALYSMPGAFAQSRSSTTALLSRAIPSSGERLPVIGAGTSGSFEVSVGSAQYEQLKQVLKIFFDSGARVFDTAPNYGPADDVLGRLLEEGGWRDSTFLATKIAADSRADAEAQWAESLRRLRTDKVELLQVHNLRDWQHQLPYARELQQQGKTRYVGVTHYIDSGLPELERILRSEKLDFIQIHYSVNSPAAARTVLPLAQDKGVAVLINRAFDDGRLFARVKDQPLPAWAQEAGIGSWAQLFLKFAISHPAVTSVIPATGRPDRQLDQLEAGRGELLTSQQQEALIRQFS
ncbi:aldo/keto reductase [Stutzerimonas kirkiae]|uniref:Aldo/keto reductase n=1 Tax=Stutzerimonas kirkiae TaxID=2211392 RepID=A0A4Q9R966_9GAMM|nr:aldo/keto reductase [Stutzerimonas kirkiae]TBU96491.1 aldo/keto reductase [Stutzerimonas kirkiae]TBV04949.1 aldo/keto reductase [Stutzerimonas kirkiae]TBV12371.1 aldo/keto reductase [Stutzerimonas kirkiae]TBV12617.1 aldo/keto reductase [Stutzerimonas kirkiae]